MLYELNDTMPGKRKISPLPLVDFSKLNLDHLLGLLFENVALLPIFRGNQPNGEADFYALNRFGDLVIFELTRSIESVEGYGRVLAHSHQAGQWTFDHHQEKYNVYCEANDNTSRPLEKIHQETFQLETPLLPLQFNSKQHLFIFANAEDDNLLEVIKNIYHLQGKDQTAALIPYRIYDIHGKLYYDFFTVQYGRQGDGGRDSLKDVLFDINYGSYETGTWDGKEESRFYTYGGTQYLIDYFQHRDVVFFFEEDRGIFAAAQVISFSRRDGEDGKFRGIEILTPIPKCKSDIKSYLSFDRIMQITGKSFFWSRGIKGPDLTRDETDKLLKELHQIKPYWT
ncbi:MAG TPA: hypothetical protein VJZ49_12075 [Syntrophales bacterium]|nr:hypothetical protein [Syntrophales bacterium]